MYLIRNKYGGADDLALKKAAPIVNRSSRQDPEVGL